MSSKEASRTTPSSFLKGIFISPIYKNYTLANACFDFINYRTENLTNFLKEFNELRKN